MTELWRFNSSSSIYGKALNFCYFSGIRRLILEPGIYFFDVYLVVASAERSIQKCFVYKWKVSFVHLPFLPSISLYCDITIIRRLIRLHR